MSNDEMDAIRAWWHWRKTGKLAPPSSEPRVGPVSTWLLLPDDVRQKWIDAVRAEARP